jgi:hypothetical protein
VNASYSGRKSASFVTLTVSGPTSAEAESEGGSTSVSFTIPHKYRGPINATARWRVPGGTPPTEEESASTSVDG